MRIVPKQRFPYSEMEYLIGEYITGYRAERNREILRQHFLLGYSQPEIAKNMDMSVIQVGRIIKNEGSYLISMLK